MPMNLVTILRRGIVKCLCNFFKIAVASDSLDHLLRRNKRKIFWNGAKSGVRDKKNTLSILIIRALPEFSVKLAQLLFGDARFIQNGPCDCFKFSGISGFIICIKPQPPLVISLQHQHVLAAHDGHQKLHHLHVLQPPVDVIPHKNIHFIVFDAAVVRQVFL